jgi:hypothetical protein
MARTKAVLSVLMTASLLGMGACAGSSDEDKIMNVAGDYVDALNDKDEQRACELQNASSREGEGCTLHSQGQTVPESPKVQSPELTGASASVLVTGEGGTEVTLIVVKEGEDWRVEEYEE